MLSSSQADDRLTERDKIKMAECFRLGDIVKAKVVRQISPYYSEESQLTPAIAG